ncbi:Fic family protein [Candidatus Parcubacteria bacterium]|nr:Fic family protein [Candidatus Parcubacteria bacterium]
MQILTEKFYKEYSEKIGNDLKQRYNAMKQDLKFSDFEYLIEASSVYSSNIEGNPMDLNSFMNTKKLKEKSRPKEFKEIRELVKAYEYAKKNDLTEKHILKAHEILSESFLIKSKRGKYRKEKVGVFGNSGLVYLAIEPEFVKKEMQKLFLDIKQLLSKKLNAERIFYYAAFIHLVFAHIHPFMDGNGRVARILEKWFLAKCLDDGVWITQTEKYYKENLQDYYKNINLGVNYYEIDYNKCMPFLLMLQKSVKK